MAWAQGRRAEFWAALYLRLKFYRIIARNLRLPGGEIDLIAKRGALLRNGGGHQAAAMAA